MSVTTDIRFLFLWFWNGFKENKARSTTLHDAFLLIQPTYPNQFQSLTALTRKYSKKCVPTVTYQHVNQEDEKFFFRIKFVEFITMIEFRVWLMFHLTVSLCRSRRMKRRRFYNFFLLKRGAGGNEKKKEKNEKNEKKKSVPPSIGDRWSAQLEFQLQFCCNFSIFSFVSRNVFIYLMLHFLDGTVQQWSKQFPFLEPSLMKFLHTHTKLEEKSKVSTNAFEALFCVRFHTNKKKFHQKMKHPKSVLDRPTWLGLAF